MCSHIELRSSCCKRIFARPLLTDLAGVPKIQIIIFSAELGAQTLQLEHLQSSPSSRDRASFERDYCVCG